MATTVRARDASPFAKLLFFQLRLFGPVWHEYTQQFVQCSQRKSYLRDTLSCAVASHATAPGPCSVNVLQWLRVDDGQRSSAGRRAQEGGLWQMIFCPTCGLGECLLLTTSARLRLGTRRSSSPLCCGSEAWLTGAYTTCAARSLQGKARALQAAQPQLRTRPDLTPHRVQPSPGQLDGARQLPVAAQAAGPTSRPKKAEQSAEAHAAGASAQTADAADDFFDSLGAQSEPALVAEANTASSAVAPSARNSCACQCGPA